MRGEEEPNGVPAERRRGRMTITRKSDRVSKRPDARGGVKLLRPTARVRWSRVQAAQARIASGYYDREDVQNYVVEQILRELKRH